MKLIFGAVVFGALMFSQSPDWAKDAIWYQIFPERFCNGDATNDPTVESLVGTWPYETQTEWEVMPWTSDWYKLQPWEEKNERGFYYNAQLRRYGGDIQGIIDKLDYLENLGINAIYLNPVFESSSSHKYGCSMYHHIDNNFGPDPIGDEKQWKNEIPNKPETWQWTSADLLFLELIEKVHQRDMKIIIDGVFNHTGIPFWALQDVKLNGKNSEFADWFTIKSFDNPSTDKDEFEYECWFGITDLPELKEDKDGLIEPIKEHIFAVAKRWMDPNGDGNPDDGVDGWRLDVADMVGQQFWSDFREWTKSINPDCYLVGEVWWKDYMKNIQYNAAPWLGDDGFDAVMNYRFGDAVFKFFNDEKKQISATKFDKMLTQIRQDYGSERCLILQNLVDSHDLERFASAVVNPDRWMDHASNLQYDPQFLTRKPNEYEQQKQKLILAFQFTYLGTPYIYYGDEVGMWGADDPDCRKPMIWKELDYDDEKMLPFGKTKFAETVEVDEELLHYYKSLIQLRKNYVSLRRGYYKTVLADNKIGLFAFERKFGDEKIIAIFNSSKTEQAIPNNLFDEKETVIFGKNGKTLNSKSMKVILND